MTTGRLDSADSVRFANRSWRLIVWMTAASLAVAVALGILVDELSGSSWLFDEALRAVVFAPVFLLLIRALHFPELQLFVEIGRSGIAFGPKQFVPWNAIARIELKKTLPWGRRELILRTSNWEPERPIRFLRFLPPSRKISLSVFDTRQPAEEWLDVVRRFAPESIVAALPELGVG